MSLFKTFSILCCKIYETSVNECTNTLTEILSRYDWSQEPMPIQNEFKYLAEWLIGFLYLKLLFFFTKNTLGKICQNTGINGSEKTRILTYFTQEKPVFWHISRRYWTKNSNTFHDFSYWLQRSNVHINNW